LGYTLYYDLQLFSYDYNSGFVFYSGFPYFTDISATNIRRQKVWMKRRKEAYEGSVMHFMRALFQNKLAENKFEVRYVIEYREKDDIVPQLLGSADITHTLDSGNRVLEFPYKLEITYKGNTLPNEYLRLQSGQANSNYGTSIIQLINAKNVQISPNGNYYNPLNLLENGYWAWSEKVCNMLPFDYEP
jgi:hypothetical protein